MHVLTPKEFREKFEKFRSEHERDWIKTAQMIRYIKEYERWEYFWNPDYKDFMRNFLWYEIRNDDDMLDALEYIEKNHPELLKENNKDYVPPYKFIEYIYKEDLTEEQTKEIDKGVFAGWTKKQIREVLKGFEEKNTPDSEKTRLKKLKIKRLGRNLQEELEELPRYHNIRIYEHKLVKKALGYIKNIVREFLSKLST